MGKKKIIGVLLLFMMFLWSGMMGQTRVDSLKRKHNESVTIYGTANPVIRQANKRFFKPEIPAFKTSEQSGHWIPSVNKFDTRIDLQTVKPKLVPVSEKREAWKNYLIAGLGSRISPYAEFYHSGWRKNDYTYQVHLGHRSSFKNIKNYLPSPYTNSVADFSFSKIMGYHKFSADGRYSLNTLRYYGYNTSLDTSAFDKNDTLFRQRYSHAQLAVDFKSVYKNFDKLHHQIHLEGDYFSDRYGGSEQHLNFQFDLHKAFRAVNVLDHQQLGIGGAYTWFNDKTLYQQQADQFVEINPYFDARYGILSFRIGARVNWLKQIQSKIRAYPSVKVNLELLKNALGLFSGVGGGLEKNSRIALTRENPYLSAFENWFLWQNTKWKLFAGFKGNIARQVDFSFMASRSSFENRAFFDYEQYFFVGTEPIPAFYSAVNSSYYTFRKNEFVLRYNNGKVTQLNGHVEWSHASTARVWIDAVYQQFDLENAYKPLYQPKVRASFGASYRWKQRYKPWITVNYVGKRWASKQSFGLYSGLYQMDAYWDVNLGMDYQMNKQSMVFFRVTNLFNKQYFRFNNYPVAGLEIMLGIRYKF